jgi:hypothetical protein
MARNALGQFTSRAAPRISIRGRSVPAATVAARRIARFEPITGVEVDGVVSGEPIVFKPEVEPQTASKSSKS